MKLKLIIVGFIIFSLNPVLKAQEWSYVDQTFVPEGNYRLFHGCFIDDQNGWFSDYYPGIVFRTKNGGGQWTQIFDTVNTWLHDMTFIDTLYGWIIAENISVRDPFLLKTKNGGQSWEKIEIPTVFTLFMLDTVKGFAAGNSIYKTTDGGYSWTLQQIDTTIRFSITEIYFTDENHGWAVGYNNEYTDAGIIFKTDDGGNLWKANLPDTYPLMAVHFSDTLRGCAVGTSAFLTGMVMHTEDGGKNWSDEVLPVGILNDVYYIADGLIYIVGWDGAFCVSTDNGYTWQPIETGATIDLHQIIFTDNGQTGYVLGDDNTLIKYVSGSLNVGNVRQGEDLKLSICPNMVNSDCSSLQIQVTLKDEYYVTLRIYDVTGQEIEKIYNGYQAQGVYKTFWTIKGFPQGIYFCRMQLRNLSSGNDELYSVTEKIILK